MIAHTGTENRLLFHGEQNDSAAEPSGYNVKEKNPYTAMK
jgi:hypothetical protein